MTRKRRHLGEPLEVVPGERRVREHSEEVADRGHLVLLGRLLQRVAEDRVCQILLDPDPLEEGEVGLLQVARLPADDRVVDREDDGGVPARLGAANEALGELAVGGPVELVPAGRLGAAGLGHVLHRGRGRGGDDQRQAQRRGGARGRELALFVEDLLDADRRQQHRGGHRGSGHLRREVAGRDVAHHAGDGAPRPERLQVRAHRVLGPGAAPDVGDRALLEGLLGGALELGPGDRLLGALGGEHPLRVDLAVVVAEHRRQVGSACAHAIGKPRDQPDGGQRRGPSRVRDRNQTEPRSAPGSACTATVTGPAGAAVGPARRPRGSCSAGRPSASA